MTVPFVKAHETDLRQMLRGDATAPGRLRRALVLIDERNALAAAVGEVLGVAQQWSDDGHDEAAAGLASLVEVVIAERTPYFDQVDRLSERSPERPRASRQELEAFFAGVEALCAGGEYDDVARQGMLDGLTLPLLEAVSDALTGDQRLRTALNDQLLAAVRAGKLSDDERLWCLAQVENRVRG